MTSRVDVGGMNQLRTSATPHIPTRTTGRLLDELAALARRAPADDECMELIRNGDDHALMQAIRRLQQSEQDAAVVALGGLLPRMCAVVIDRHSTVDWKAAIDDYVALAYLVMLDIDPDTDAHLLSQKVLARTRRRHERQVGTGRVVPVTHERLVELAPTVDDIEDRALDHLRLLEVGAAVKSGRVSPRLWQAVVAISLTPRRGPASARDRRAVARARQALEHLNDCGKAA